MISDADLYTLAIFLGCLSMLLIVLYHFLEVNAKDDLPANPDDKAAPASAKGGAQTPGRSTVKS
ncbi:hypothetical protein MMC21_005929 [Puttea exsequens]|nr:hypothetical protein [Puttea exsequens]